MFIDPQQEPRLTGENQVEVIGPSNAFVGAESRSGSTRCPVSLASAWTLRSNVSTRIWRARWAKNSTRPRTLTTLMTNAKVTEILGTNRVVVPPVPWTVRSTARL